MNALGVTLLALFLALGPTLTALAVAWVLGKLPLGNADER